jgi:hypothetical protein
MVVKALIFKLTLLPFCCTSFVFSQSFYDNKNHFSVDFGTMHNNPKSMNFTNEIRPLASIDVNFAISYELIKNKTGWLFTLGGGTQSVRYKRRSLDGSFPTTQTTIGNNGRYIIGVKKTYNFNATNYCNFNLSFGPNLLLNRLTDNYDSLRLIQNTTEIAYNIKPIGIALQTTLRVVFKAKTRIKYYLIAGYQFGFVDIREARILTTDLIREEVFKYNGTGANFGIGILLAKKSDLTSKTNVPN